MHDFQTSPLRMFMAFVIVTVYFCDTPASGAENFSFRPFLNTARTLSASVESIAGRKVTINGVDTASPDVPFTFEWGDGTTNNAWFPAQHTYPKAKHNYTVRVTAHYAAAQSDSVEVLARFKPVDWSYTPDPDVDDLIVIPSTPVSFVTTMPGYAIPGNDQIIDSGELSPAPRSAIEYALCVARALQLDYCQNDVTAIGLGEQVFVRETTYLGSFSYWYTNPPAMACWPTYYQPEVQFSSLFHEVGHNLTLNCPAAFHLGGKIDGNMNAIFSEALAGIFQHATVYDILNTKGHYGISQHVIEMIKYSGIASARSVTGAYDRIARGESPVTTYNDPATGEDETLDTFQCVVYVFMDLAEKQGGYRAPLVKTMEVFRTFNQADAANYQTQSNEAFRCTFWVAALSHGFDKDLRSRFRTLGFPVDNKTYRKLTNRVTK